MDAVLDRCGVPTASQSVYPHILLDRAKPGLIAVNRTGRRFVNEANSYHDFAVAMLRPDRGGPSVPAWLICDRSFVRDYGLGLVHPRTRNLARFIKAGYLVEAGDIRALAGTIGVNPEALEKTIADHNRYAATGIDAEFGRGSTDLNRFNGDPGNKPNPCMRPIGPGPYYALAVRPVDFAGSAGLLTDENGNVLDAKGKPIEGSVRGRHRCRVDLPRYLSGTRHHAGSGTCIRLARRHARRAYRRHIAGQRVRVKQITRAARGGARAAPAWPSASSFFFGHGNAGNGARALSVPRIPARNVVHWQRKWLA